MTDSLEQWIEDFTAKIRHLETDRDSWKAKALRGAGKEELRYKLMAEEELRRVLSEHRDQLADRWEHLKFHLVAEEWPDEQTRQTVHAIVELMDDLAENENHSCAYAVEHPGID